MKLFNKIASFRRGQDGVVTVDWVVLTAAVVGLGIAAMAVVRGGVQDLSESIFKGVTATTIQTDVKTEAGE